MHSFQFSVLHLFLTIFMEGAGDGFVWLVDKRHV